MIRQFIYTISHDCAGQTISRFLRSIGYSAHILTQLKKIPSNIQINSICAYSNYMLHIDDILTVILKEDGNSNIVSSSIPLNILYEDEDILVINKSSHIPVHPSQGHFDDTLANAVAFYLRNKHQDCPFRCINRLDRDTSGVILIAKNSLSAAILSQQMINRTIHRTYLALAYGHTLDSGTINAPIGRVKGCTIERCIDYLQGESAITHYSKIRQYDSFSLICLRLETGRTHQIRVHMKHIGHPLLGDYIYNPNFDIIKRQALHSYSLEFVHPITKKSMLFTAPVPIDFSNAYICKF